MDGSSACIGHRPRKRQSWCTLTALNDHDKINIEKLFLYLLNPNADILKIRLVNEKIESGNILFDEEQRAGSLTRKVTGRVMNNVAKIRQAIDDGDAEKLTEEDRDGNVQISANFYEALKGFGLDSEETRVEFSADWTPTVKNLK